MLTIYWTDTAKETYEYILSYLVEFWGDKIVRGFILRTENILNLISANPLIFNPILEDTTVRRAILHKNCSFLYRIKGNSIEIIAFWDTRQEPFL